LPTSLTCVQSNVDVMCCWHLQTTSAKACKLDTDVDAVHLARAAQIVRRHIIGDSTFSGFPAGCQQDSVPPTLLALVSMILEGPSIKHQSESTTPAALTIAQLLKFNSVKHRRAAIDSRSAPRSVRHAATQETPAPNYIGLMLHAHTRKRELVDRLAHIGISISYDRVLSLSTQLGYSTCRLYHQEQVVCPPTMRGDVFNWASFLRVDDNKTELFCFLSGALLDSFQLAEKQLVITNRDAVLSKPPLLDTTSRAPCAQEEVDSCMMLHAAHAGHSKITIRTVNTDVVVLAVALACTLEEDDEVWVSFGTGKAFRFLAAHEMARAVGPEKAQALPMFHALTRCDMVSCFAGRGKRRVYTHLHCEILPFVTNL